MRQETLNFALIPADNSRLANLCGTYDDNIREIGRILDVQIKHRGEMFSITGSGEHATRARDLLNRLYQQSDKAVDLDMVRDEISGEAQQPSQKDIVAGVKARGATQSRYLGCIRNNAVTFGVGASGTGKTFLAVASAVSELGKGNVARIVLVRPAVEAGENLGFLPGDPVQKVNPYLRPLQDALNEISNGNGVEDLLRRGRIELAPLAYMRGRTLNNSFVILDEAQNTTVAQMKMFLTRLGHESRCVVTGDESQVDLPREEDSGLTDVIGRVSGVKSCAVVRFAPDDTMRHPVVSRILKVYDK